MPSECNKLTMYLVEKNPKLLRSAWEGGSENPKSRSQEGTPYKFSIWVSISQFELRNWGLEVGGRWMGILPPPDSRTQDSHSHLPKHFPRT